MSPKGSHPLKVSRELGLVQFSHLDVSDSLWTPCSAVRQASLSNTNSRTLLKLASICRW